MRHIQRSLIALSVSSAILIPAIHAAAQQPPPPNRVFPTGLTFASPADVQKIPLAGFPLMGTPPPSFDLSSTFPAPGDQGKQGSCVGWAVAHALKSHQEMAERMTSGSWKWGPDTTFSPAWVYNHAKASTCDGGAYYPTALDFVKENGAATVALFPYDATVCSRKYTAAEKVKALPFRIASYERVPVDDKFAIQSQLVNGRPVLIGMKVDRAFMNLGTGLYPGLTGTVEGGHALVIVGYDNGRGGFKVINSWGSTWGDKGFGWIAYDVFAPFKNTVVEAYVVTDVTGTAPTTTGVTPTKGTGPASTLSVVQRRYESLGTISNNTKTGDHHCSSNCAGEPTRTPYSVELKAGEGRQLRNPRLVCVGDGCPYSEISYVRLNDQDRTARAEWTIWGSPTVWRLEAEEIRIEDVSREARTTNRGDLFEVVTQSGDAPPQIAVTVAGREYRVGPSANAPESGVVYVGRQDKGGNATYLFRVVGAQ